MQLTKRLLMSAEMVTKGYCVADVGCDHAYTSIWLVQQGIAGHCIAMDLREGPLMHAKENVKMCHCESRIETRLSDGLDKLVPGEADSILITGMGGALMERILEKGSDCVQAAHELVLQPQSEPEKVRKFIYEHGYFIAKEACCRDFGKFYVSIYAKKGAELAAPYSESELTYGRYLPDGKNPIMYEYLLDEHRKALLVREQLENISTESAAESMDRFLEKIKLIEEALKKYEF